MPASAATTDIEYIGSWGETRRREGERIYQMRPLIDDYALCVAIKNTGTGTIDHFSWQQTSSLAHMNIDLLQPRIPPQLWRPFAGNLVSATFRREVTVRSNRVEVTNPDIQRPVELETFTSVDGEIEPGQVFMFRETEKPYFEYLREGTESKGLQLGARIDLAIVNKEEALLKMIVKEFKLGPISLHDIVLQIELRGRVGALQQVLIDNRIYATKEVELNFA